MRVRVETSGNAGVRHEVEGCNRIPDIPISLAVCDAHHRCTIGSRGELVLLGNGESYTTTEGMTNDDLLALRAQVRAVIEAGRQALRDEHGYVPPVYLKAEALAAEVRDAHASGSYRAVD